MPFKATAGLHHPLRAEQALTYAADSPRGVMHGFLNVFAAAALAREGAPTAEVEAVLREERRRGPSASTTTACAWRERRLATDGARGARGATSRSRFGSCSFAEPVADLRALGVTR